MDCDCLAVCTDERSRATFSSWRHCHMVYARCSHQGRRDASLWRHYGNVVNLPERRADRKGAEWEIKRPQWFPYRLAVILSGRNRATCKWVSWCREAPVGLCLCPDPGPQDLTHWTLLVDNRRRSHDGSRKWAPVMLFFCSCWPEEVIVFGPVKDQQSPWLDKFISKFEGHCWNKKQFLLRHGIEKWLIYAKKKIWRKPNNCSRWRMLLAWPKVKTNTPYCENLTVHTLKIISI